MSLLHRNFPAGQCVQNQKAGRSRANEVRGEAERISRAWLPTFRTRSAGSAYTWRARRWGGDGSARDGQNSREWQRSSRAGVSAPPGARPSEAETAALNEGRAACSTAQRKTDTFKL
eukprot:3154401-Pleurochrysis_carterae.AAC.5